MANQFQPQIVMRDPNTLTPYHRNNKKHPTSQIDKLAGAIAEFHFDQPIVVDGKGVIIKGHGRREAALRLGLKEVPVIVRIDLTPAQVKAARLSDNQLPKEGRDDYDAIALELAELDDLGFDLNLTGFDAAEIDKFLEGEQTEYQGSQVFGGSGDASESDEEEGGGGAGDEDNAVAKSPPEKYPLAIVLTASQKQQWDGIKTVLGIKNDTAALLKILELGVKLK